MFYCIVVECSKVEEELGLVVVRHDELDVPSTARVVDTDDSVTSQWLRERTDGLRFWPVVVLNFISFSDWVSDCL